MSEQKKQYLKKLDVEQFDKEKPVINGFFNMIIGDSWEGNYFHSGSIGRNEEGTESLLDWIESLLYVINNIDHFKYIAFSEIEIPRWLEFKLSNENILISAMIQESKNVNVLILTSPSKGFIYDIPFNYPVRMDLFIKEIKKAREIFVNELCEINPILRKSNLVMELY